MSRDECPAGDVLSRYASGELSDDAALAVSSHLETCGDCLAQLDGLIHRTDPLIARLRRPRPGEPGTNPQLASAIARVLAPAAGPAAPAPGEVLNGYRLLGEIGRGGMGRVYRAVHPRLGQEVAVKVLRPGMDSAPILARFEAERQALAVMNHPNIARVLDGGVTEAGAPFFVMELVRGAAVTRYCHERRLALRERLGLFVGVCLAVQHAHQKGVIHRDLKPSNVLVVEYDGRPVPKVIDFGVAKALDRRAAAETEVGMLIGTPQYMSPEQADVASSDIDTRSDIYALGVLLYELLTGDTPITRGRLRDAPVLEVLRMVREEDPPCPSSRLGAAETAVGRATSPGPDAAGLARQVRGELDWVVMKCLEKDRNRRYESAAALAEDVRRFLNDEPVLAGPPGRGYRLKKFVRRHRGAVLAAGLVLAALLLGMAGTTWGLVWALDEKDAKEQARVEAVTNAEKARGSERQEREAREQAQARLGQIEKANALLGSIFADLDPRAPLEEGKSLQQILGERLDKATAQLDGEAVGDALAVARLQETLGRSQRGLGYPDKAIALLEKALRTRKARLGEGHPDTLVTMSSLALVYLETGRVADALPLFEASLRDFRTRFGSDHPDTLVCMNNLATAYLNVGRLREALALLEDAYPRTKAKLGDDRATLACLSNLATAYEKSGRVDDALRLFGEALKLRRAKLGRGHPDTLASMANLAGAYSTARRHADAVPLLVEALGGMKAKLGRDHPDTLACMNNLASAYKHTGRPDDALRLFEEAFELTKAKLGADHPTALAGMNNLAAAYLDARRLPDTLRLSEQARKLAKAKLGPGHPTTLLATYNLAVAYQKANRPADALPLFEEAYPLLKITFGGDHQHTISVMNYLALSYKRAGRFADALPLLEEAVELSKAQLGPGHRRTLSSINNLAMAYRDADRPNDALPLFLAAAAGARKVWGPKHASTHTILLNLAGCHERLGEHAKAEPLYREMAEFWKQQAGADSQQYAAALSGLGQCLLAQKKYAGAEAPLRECLAIRDKKEPGGLGAAYVKWLLGESLLGRGKYAEGEPLLAEGYAGLEKAQAAPVVRARLTEGLRRAVEAYAAAGKPDEAARWRARLPSAGAPRKASP